MELRHESEVYGKSAEELDEIGKQFFEQGQLSAAHKHFIASLKKKANPNVMFRTASCLLELARPQEAKQYLKQSCELAPDSQPEKWLTLGELEEGKDSLCCLEKAVELLERELASEPVAMDEDMEGGASENTNNARKFTSRKLSNAYVCISELFTTDLCDEPNAEERVVASIEKALELDPSNPEAVQAKASYHLIKGEFEDATREIKRSLDMWLPAFERSVEGGLEDADEVPPFNVRLSAVKLLLDLELFTEATTILDGLVLEDENCVDVWYLLGWTNFLRMDHYLPTAKFYLKKASKVGSAYGCDDEGMMNHIEELLEDLKEIQSEDEDDEDSWSTEDEEN